MHLIINPPTPSRREHLSRVARLREEAIKRKAENKVKQEGAGVPASVKSQPAQEEDEDEDDDEEEELVLGSLLDWRARGTA